MRTAFLTFAPPALSARGRLSHSTTRQSSQTGMTLLELVLVLTMLGLIAMIGMTSYTRAIDKANNATAAADISAITAAVDRFYTENNRFPNNLGEIGFDNLLDPWGSRYKYLRINGANLSGKGMVRKDKNLNPVNSDYDLYSTGKDGLTQLPFTAKVSHDDIVRANNGRFVGTASDY